MLINNSFHYSNQNLIPVKYAYAYDPNHIHYSQKDSQYNSVTLEMTL